MINGEQKKQTMIKSTKRQEAIDAYIGRAANIQTMLKRLTEAAGDHFGDDPESITWGHVGSLGAIEEKLRHLCNMVFREGEYAPENKG